MQVISGRNTINQHQRSRRGRDNKIDRQTDELSVKEINNCFLRPGNQLGYLFHISVSVIHSQRIPRLLYLDYILTNQVDTEILRNVEELILVVIRFPPPPLPISVRNVIDLDNRSTAERARTRIIINVMKQFHG